VKAVIPAAGLGTRFLPMTKTIPKEMLPIVDKPAIQYVVEEAVASGCDDIVIVTGRHKRAIEDHFDRAFELEHHLTERGEKDRAASIRRIGESAEIHYVRQKEPRGLGHAIWCARKHVGDEPFAVLLGDDVYVGEPPATKQLLAVHARLSASVIAVEEVPEERVHLYGIVKPGRSAGTGVSEVEDVVEKPSAGSAPSRLAASGRYIFTPRLFQALSEAKPDARGEIQLADGLRILLKSEKVYCSKFTGHRFDIGNRLDWLKTNLEIAMMHAELREPLRRHLSGRWQ